MSLENVIPVDFRNKRRLSHAETLKGHVAWRNQERQNLSILLDRTLNGLPDATDFRKTMPFAIALYHLVHDEARQDSIIDCQDRVSELLLTLDRDQTEFFSKLVEREINIEGISWLESVDPTSVEAKR